MIGHNRGPSLDGGASWRKTCWAKARKDLLPHLPIEVLRGRLKRAAELGLDYRTYAGIRACTGQDVVAVLFSSNALGMHLGSLNPTRVSQLGQVKATRIGLAAPPLAPARMLVAPLHAAFCAPRVHASFAQTRAAVRAALGRVPSDQALLIGAFAPEADWVSAARLAGYVDAARFFART